MIQLRSQATKEIRACLTFLLKYLPAKLYTLLPVPQHKSIMAFPSFDLTL